MFSLFSIDQELWKCSGLSGFEERHIKIVATFFSNTAKFSFKIALCPYSDENKQAISGKIVLVNPVTLQSEFQPALPG